MLQLEHSSSENIQTYNLWIYQMTQQASNEIHKKLELDFPKKLSVKLKRDLHYVMQFKHDPL